MAFVISDNEELPYILVSMSGVIDAAGLLAFQNAINDSPGYRRKAELVDFSGVTDYRVTADDQNAYIAIGLGRLKSQVKLPGRKVALVAPDDLTYGMSRMFLVQVEDLPGSYNLFRSKQAALDWLQD